MGRLTHDVVDLDRVEVLVVGFPGALVAFCLNLVAYLLVQELSRAILLEASLAHRTSVNTCTFPKKNAGVITFLPIPASHMIVCARKQATETASPNFPTVSATPASLI